MLKRLLKRHPEVNRIDGYFNANPFMAGCRCYLGQAADAGFKFIEDVAVGPTLRIPFTKESYVDVCEKLEKSNLKEGYGCIMNYTLFRHSMFISYFTKSCFSSSNYT